MKRRGAPWSLLPATVMWVLAAGTAGAASEPPPRTPAEVRAPNGDLEFLRADELASDPDTAIERLSGEARLRALSALRTANAEEACPEIGPYVFEWMLADGRDPNLPIRSLDDALRRAEWILVASVLDRTTGLRWGMPGTLLLLDVEEVVRGEVAAHVRLLTFAPVGELALGERRVCAVDRGFPPLPEIGDRAILLLEVPDLSYGATYLLRGAELVVLPRASKAPRFGPEIASSVPGTLRDEERLLQYLRERR